MLKHSDIMEKLTEARKLRMLTDITWFSTVEAAELGLPSIKIGELYDGEGRYPSPSALANTWDSEMISAVSEDIINRLSRDDGNDARLVLTPDVKIKTDPEGAGVTEDPCLSAAIAKSYVRAGKSAGTAVALSALGIDRQDAEWMDTVPDQRVIHEYISEPFAEAMEDGGFAVAVKNSIGEGRYGDVNRMLMAEMSDRLSENDKSFTVCIEASFEDTVDCIRRGVICLRASESALESARRRYDMIAKAIAKGDAHTEDLALETERCRAISPDEIDMAADRLIDFVLSCKKKARATDVSAEGGDSLERDAVYSSAVLLKNEGRLLPLGKRKRIAVIGDAEAFVRDMEKKGYKCVSVKMGHDRGEELLDEAEELAGKADAVILFLGHGQDGEGIETKRDLCLSAKDEALIHRLLKYSQKTVAVVSSDGGFDISSACRLGALMLMPLGLRYSAAAAADIISGEYSPSGRMAYSLYRDTDTSFEKQKNYLAAEMKAGPFIGYRYYDSADIDCGIPFGHGLGYSSFSYSSLKIKGSVLSFTLKNNGKLRSGETVQVYMGLSSSQVLRPKKELVAFEKVFLNGGESRRVEIELKPPAVYIESEKGFSLEDGEYTVFVGSSVRDIRLRSKYRFNGKKLIPDGEELRRYLQSESNIIADKFTLEADHCPMKRSIKNIICGGILLVLAVALQTYCGIIGVYSLFLQLFAAALAVAAAVFFITEAFDRARANRLDTQRAKEENERLFADAEVLESFSAEGIFRDEFGADEEAHHKSGSAEIPSEENKDDEYFGHIDRELTFPLIASELEQFALSRGVKLSGDGVRRLLASMAASRLILDRGMDGEAINALAALLGGYFETEAAVISANGTDAVKKSLVSVAKAAADDREKIHVVIFNQVGAKELCDELDDIVKYSRNPGGSVAVSDGTDSLVVPRNLWVIAVLGADVSLDTIPVSVCETAVVDSISVDLTAPSAEMFQRKLLSFYQFEHLTRSAVRTADMDETLWKRVDSFEELVNRHSGFTIGNKQWLAMERFFAVYSACGGDGAEGADRMVAVKLVPAVMSALADTENKLSLSDTLGDIFGEGRADYSRKAVKESEKIKTQQ